MSYIGYDHWFARTECPKSSKTPEKLAFLEFDLHTVEITFSILFFCYIGGGGNGEARVYIVLGRELLSRFFVFCVYISSSFLPSLSKS